MENSTWSGSFEFPASREGEWRLSINIEQTFLTEPGYGASLVEDFLYTVELDAGLYHSYGSIMFYHKQVCWVADY